MKDFFTGSQFENEFGEVWNVEEVLAYAKTWIVDHSRWSQ